MKLKNLFLIFFLVTISAAPLFGANPPAAPAGDASTEKQFNDLKRELTEKATQVDALKNTVSSATQKVTELAGQAKTKIEEKAKEIEKQKAATSAGIQALTSEAKKLGSEIKALQEGVGQSSQEGLRKAIADLAVEVGEHAGRPAAAAAE